MHPTDSRPGLESRGFVACRGHFRPSVQKATPVSPLVLLGLLGTTLSTVFMLPHLANAIRDRRPAGTAFAWALTTCQSLTWMLYGLADDDVLVAAPGFVTVPIGTALTVWAFAAARGARKASAAAPVIATASPVEALQEIVAAMPSVGLDREIGDTLELPRVVAA